MNGVRKPWAGMLVGAMTGACGGIQLAAQHRDPKAGVAFAFFALCFALLGGITGAIFQAAIAPRKPACDEHRSGELPGSGSS